MAMRLDAAVSSVNQVVVYTEPGVENSRYNSVVAAKNVVATLRERGFKSATYMTAKERGVQIDAAMSMAELKANLLEKAKRRTVVASSEARLLQVEVAQIRAALQALRAEGLVYSSGGKSNFWGGAEKEFKAMDSLNAAASALVTKADAAARGT